MVGEANASQHSIQLVTCGGQICLRSGRGWGGKDKGYIGGQLANKVFMGQVNINGFGTITRHLSSEAAHSHLYSPHTSTS